VQDTSTEEYYVVSFEDGTYCDNLPPTDIIVSYLIHFNHFLSDSWEIIFVKLFMKLSCNLPYQALRQLKLMNSRVIFLSFQNRSCSEKYIKDNKHNSLLWHKNMFACLSADIICSSKLTVQSLLLGTDNVRRQYPCISLRQMEAIVYIVVIFVEPRQPKRWYSCGNGGASEVGRGRGHISSESHWT